MPAGAGTSGLSRIEAMVFTPITGPATPAATGSPLQNDARVSPSSLEMLMLGLGGR